MTEVVKIEQLTIARELRDFIETEALPGTGVRPGPRGPVLGSPEAEVASEPIASRRIRL